MALIEIDFFNILLSWLSESKRFPTPGLWGGMSHGETVLYGSTGYDEVLAIEKA